MAVTTPASTDPPGPAHDALPPLLAWFGGTHDLPDGTDADGTDADGTEAPPLTGADWTSVHARLAAADHARATVPSPLEIGGRAAAVAADAPGAVPIVVADYDVHVAAPEDAAAAARAAAAERRAVDPSTLARRAAPRRIFAAAAILPERWGRDEPAHPGPRVTLRLDERLWLLGPGRRLPREITIDPGDGTGARPVALGESVRADYGRGRAAVVTIRAAGDDGERVARLTFPIGADDAPPAPDDTWPLAAGTDAGEVTGRAWVFRAPGHADVVNPLLVAEGFPGRHDAAYLYALLNQGGLLETLRWRGYDVVFVGFADGTVGMERNAALVVACIEEARRRTRAPLVVAGVSMGGLVARYALAWMEHHRRPHDARVLLTIDTPHLGAYTCLAVQWFAHFLGHVSPTAALLAGALDTTANQQFLRAWVTDGRAVESPERDRFLKALAAVGGWPSGVRKLAVACGHARGLEPGARAADGGLLLSWDGEPFARVALRATAHGAPDDPIAEGRSVAAPGPAPAPLRAAGDVVWELVPGGTNRYNAQAAGIARAFRHGEVRCPVPDTCAVPTVSALAIEQDPRSPIPPPGCGRSPFDDYVCCDRNEPHLTITPAVATWIDDRLGPPPPSEPPTTAMSPATTSPAAPPAAPLAAPLAAAPGFDPAAFDPHAREFLADPYPVFAAFRQHAPVHLVPSYESHWVFRHADVQQALEDGETFVKALSDDRPDTGTLFDAMDHMADGPFSLDPPRHTALRGALEGVLGPAFGAAPAIADGIAAELLAGIGKRGTRRIELIAEYALPLPAGVLFAVLGLPKPHWPGLTQLAMAIALAHDRTQSVAVQQQGGLAAMALHAYFQAMLRGPGADVATPLGRMVAAATANGCGADDVQASCVDIVVAGFLSTTFLIATGVRTLVGDAALRDRVARAGASRDDVAELLRHEPPAQIVDRVVAVDTTLGGVPLRRGDKVALVLGSANRDEAAFDRPDAFVPGRADAARAIPFGDGIHRCIGAPLVQAVAPIAISRLLAAFPTLALDGLVQWQTDPYLRAPTNLPLVIR